MKQHVTLFTLVTFLLLPLFGCGGSTEEQPAAGTGNNDDSTTTAVVDTTPPTVKITSHADSDDITGDRTVTLTGTLSDQSIIQSLTVTFNGADVTAKTTKASTPTFDQSSFSVQLTLADRDNTVEVRATDEAGNSGSSGQITLEYPYINLTTFQGANVVIGHYLMTDFQANDGFAAPKDYTLDQPAGNSAIVDDKLFLPDSRNNRVMIFNTLPLANGTAADLALGQPDFNSDASGLGMNNLLFPSGVQAYDGKLFVADPGNNRVLIWNTIPTTMQAPADVVVGVTNTAHCLAGEMKNPIALFVVDGKLLVADSSYDRVLIWNSIPTSNGVAADLVLGQAALDQCAGSPTSATSLSYPAGIWSDGERVVVADYDNNRVLIWNSFPTVNGTAADVVVGQDTMTGNSSAAADKSFRHPNAVISNGNQLMVADGDNNRVMVWNSFPASNGVAADVVLGQSNFTYNAPNDNDQNGTADGLPGAHTFYNPSGFALDDETLIVLDRYNSRALVFN